MRRNLVAVRTYRRLRGPTLRCCAVAAADALARSVESRNTTHVSHYPVRRSSHRASRAHAACHRCARCSSPSRQIQDTSSRRRPACLDTKPHGRHADSRDSAYRRVPLHPWSHPCWRCPAVLPSLRACHSLRSRSPSSRIFNAWSGVELRKNRSVFLAHRFS